MTIISKIQTAERGRFAIIAFLLFFNAMILESNEVVATTGFISNIGVPQLLFVWAIDMSIIIVTSGIYSLFVDRRQRGRLAVSLYIIFAAVYLILYVLFTASPIGFLGYGFLLVINDQQWLLFPLVVWALANDMFSLSEAKRLFPILGIAAFAGGMIGNAVAALIARWAGASFNLLLFNAIIILASGIILLLTINRMKITNRQSRAGEKVLDALREGLGFVREVPIYRFLTLAMVLLGIGLNAIEFDFLFAVSQTYPDGVGLQSFYGTFKIVVAIGLLIVQGFIASRLLSKLGFKYIFVILPCIMFSGLLLSLFWPGVLGVIIGNYFVRVTKLGIEDPSNKAFQGMVPDERRGRVSAFMDGYLYPLGSILGCVIVGSAMFAVSQGTIDGQTARFVYLGMAVVCTVIAIYSVTRIHLYYDTSMLNWRLKRRKRASALADIEF